jgi:hypothetical protein
VRERAKTSARAKRVNMRFKGNESMRGIHQVKVNFTFARRKGIMFTIRISGAWPCIHDRAAAAAAAAEVEVHRPKNQIVCVCVRVLACLRACARLHPTVGYCRCLIISDSISDAAWMARMVVSACTTNHAPLSLDSACLSMLSAA